MNCASSCLLVMRPNSHAKRRIVVAVVTVCTSRWAHVFLERLEVVR